MSVAIDLGDKACRLVAWRGNVTDLVPGGTIPSVVALGIEKLLVGKEAVKEVDTKHHNVIRFPVWELRAAKKHKLKHPKGGSRFMYSDNAISALLSQLKEKAIKRLGEPVRHLTLSIPPGLTSREKQQIRTSVKAAGFHNFDMLSSHEAAVFHWCTSAFKPNARNPTGSSNPHHKAVDMKILVIDSGARMTSVSVVHLQIPTPTSIDVKILDCCSFRYGGIEVDKRLLHHAPQLNNVVLPIVMGAVENAKKDLSSLKDSQIRVKDATRIINRSHLTVAAAPLLRRISAAAALLLEKYAASTALLVGGSSRLLDIHHLVTKELGLRVEVEDYDFAASLGAAKWAGTKTSTPARVLQRHPANLSTGHNFFAVCGDVASLQPDPSAREGDVKQLFTDKNWTVLPKLKEDGDGEDAEGEDDDLLRPADVSGDEDSTAGQPPTGDDVKARKMRWLVFEQICGSRAPLTAGEILHHFHSIKGKPDDSQTTAERVVRKKADAELGIQFLEWQDCGPQSQGALESIYVKPGSEADRSGLRGLVGWRLSTINGRTVNSNAEVGKMRGSTKLVFRFYRDGLPAASGENEADDVVCVGWAAGGTKLELTESGVLGLRSPQELPSEDGLQQQLEADADHARTLREFSESRNDLEAATLRLADSGMCPDDLKDICTNAPHYIDLAQMWLVEDTKDTKASDITRLASFVNTMMNASEDPENPEFLASLNSMEEELNRTVPKSIPGAISRKGRESRWKLLARKRQSILEKMGRKKSGGGSAMAKLARRFMEVQKEKKNVDSVAPDKSPMAGPASPKMKPAASPKHRASDPKVVPPPPSGAASPKHRASDSKSPPPPSGAASPKHKAADAKPVPPPSGSASPKHRASDPKLAPPPPSGGPRSPKHRSSDPKLAPPPPGGARSPKHRASDPKLAPPPPSGGPRSPKHRSSDPKVKPPSPVQLEQQQQAPPPPSPPRVAVPTLPVSVVMKREKEREEVSNLRGKTRNANMASRSPLYGWRAVQVSPASPIRRSGSPPHLRIIPSLISSGTFAQMPEPDPAPCRWKISSRPPARQSASVRRRESTLSPSPELLHRHGFDICGDTLSGWSTARTARTVWTARSRYGASPNTVRSVSEG